MMAYTVKQLAQLSGVSIRTLRFYDDIGILKPAYYGDNGYRYYQQEQLLILQQILFFRELNMPLKDIQHVLNAPNFNVLDRLKSHKVSLEQRIERTKKLLVTLEKTIANLSGENKMSVHEMYDGFDPNDMPHYDQIAIDEQGDIARSFIKKRMHATQNWGKAEWDKLNYEWNSLLLEITDALHQGLTPNSPKVQQLMDKKFQICKSLYQPTKQEYLAMRQINCNHPEYKKQFDFYDVNLAKYIEDATGIFAEREFV